MRARVAGGKCSSVVTVFCSPRHSVLRARDLEERGEIFVGGDEQAMVVHKLAAIQACSLWGVHRDSFAKPLL
jgi:hypothetical protein